MAASNFFSTSSKSSSLKSVNGRFNPLKSTIGFPFTRTMKFPRPGFSGFMTTLAFVPLAVIAFTNRSARLRNIPHCEQRSMETSNPPAAADDAATTLASTCCCFFVDNCCLEAGAFFLTAVDAFFFIFCLRYVMYCTVT